MYANTESHQIGSFSRQWVPMLELGNQKNHFPMIWALLGASVRLLAEILGGYVIAEIIVVYRQKKLYAMSDYELHP